MNKQERDRIEHVRFEIWTETRYAEVNPSSDPSEDYEEQIENTVHVVPEHKADEFGEWMANELGYQDYGNKIYFKHVATLTGEQLIIIDKQLVDQARRMLEQDKKPRKETDCRCGGQGIYQCECGEYLCGHCFCKCGGQVKYVGDEHE